MPVGARAWGPAMIVLAAAAWLAGCSGDAVITSGGASTAPPLLPGSAILSGNSMRGVVAFEDASGAQVAPPALGAMVVVTTVPAGPLRVAPVPAGSRCGGADGAGRFQLDGLPVGQDLCLQIGGEGFLPFLLDIPVGASGLPPGTLTVVQDRDTGDDPVLEGVRCAVGLDGTQRLAGRLTDGSVLVPFLSEGSDTDSLAGASGEALPVELYQGSGGMSPFHVTMPFPLPTGALYAGAFRGDPGFRAVVIKTCSLDLRNPQVSGSAVSGKLKESGEGGLNVDRGEVLVWDSANPSGNRKSGKTEADGTFSLALDSAPTGPVRVHVQWENKVDKKTYCCVFEIQRTP